MYPQSFIAYIGKQRHSKQKQYRFKLPSGRVNHCVLLYQFLRCHCTLSGRSILQILNNEKHLCAFVSNTPRTVLPIKKKFMEIQNIWVSTRIVKIRKKIGTGHSKTRNRAVGSWNRCLEPGYQLEELIFGTGYYIVRPKKSSIIKKFGQYYKNFLSTLYRISKKSQHLLTPIENLFHTTFSYFYRVSKKNLNSSTSKRILEVPWRTEADS